MFYLTTHTTHLLRLYGVSIWTYNKGRKEGTVLFNDAHNTFVTAMWRKYIDI